jgi:hypothetical protein
MPGRRPSKPELSGVLVLARDFGKDAHHRRLGWCGDALPPAGQQDAPGGGGLPERDDADVGVWVGDGGPWGECDAKADADHGLGLLVVVGVEGNAGAEAGGAAAAVEHLGDRVVGFADDPFLGGEVGHVDPLAVGKRVVGGDDEHGGVVEQVGEGLHRLTPA